MAVYANLRAQALADTALNAAIAGRFGPGELPYESALPAVRYFQVSGPPADEVPALYRERWQFNVWGATYSEAKDTARLVVAAFCDGWTNKSGTPKVLWGRKLNELDAREETTDRWRAVVDIELLVGG